ncbi:pyridoxal phosphate-dependent aminotransferase family protein [Tenacibaculum sp. IB213877]|uniref:aminotransferase class I/II-fold pyridoxal phosphate-dependent enzyme n=1 Tax=Tenacibaculum sp. IB213877 TaxID=3097351 RepID=UPI002A5A18CC|nr:pyridoxal phosphate-dependent aminotransferase family protein [Tenacibaculum sp. IB213877]MDY0780630.1 pyridoxal phosphate-dependent aminotransferase family protein [Tenacibaculum sp. IB213877]
MIFPKKLEQKLKLREENEALRTLDSKNELVDFSSNDYLGFTKSELIFDKTHQFLIEKNFKLNGATGSRLLTGNHLLYSEVEVFLADFHNTESTLVFNSGYDANIGFFASVPQRGDVILYDEFIHASIRDGIQLSNAKAYKFQHNTIEELEKLLIRHSELVSESHSNIYVVTESVFSMDGDSPDLAAMIEIIKKNNAYLIVDEAHAMGVFGAGLVQKLNLENEVFARIITFGKALGCHGAAILGSKKLTRYLVNFARSFIYTTGLSPHSLATIKTSYEQLDDDSTDKLHQNIHHFKSEIERLELKNLFIESNSAIHCCVISGNTKTKNIANQLQQNGFNIKPILSPTVTEGKERLRFCLHSYNSTQEITQVLENLATFAI